jgi:hypothetical protein
MNSPEHDRLPESPDEDLQPHGEFTAARAEVDAHPRRLAWLLLSTGVVAGLVAFALGEPLYKFIPPKLVPRDLMGTKIMVPSLETECVATTKNSALAFGALGFCLAGSLGVVGGFGRRATSSPLRGGLIGAVLGATLGAGVSLGLLPWSILAQADYPDHDLILAMATHSVIWGLIGAAAGLAFAVGLGERRLCASILMAGMAGAVIGAIAFELIGGTFFGLAETGKPISKTWLTRLMARLLVTVGTSIVVAMTLPKDLGRRGTSQSLQTEPTSHKE